MTELRCNFIECPYNFECGCTNQRVIISVSGECKQAKEIEINKTDLVYPPDIED